MLLTVKSRRDAASLKLIAGSVIILKPRWPLPVFCSLLGKLKSYSAVGVFSFRTPKDFPAACMLPNFCSTDSNSCILKPKTSTSKSLEILRSMKWSRTAPPTRIPRPSERVIAFAILFSSEETGRRDIKGLHVINEKVCKHLQLFLETTIPNNSICLR